MKQFNRILRMSISLGALLAPAASAIADDEPLRLGGSECPAPAVLRCPDADCSPERILHPGTVVEMKTRRTYFLDYPCDLKKGEKVTLILSLHGAGSYGNWQRHYFPLLDYKDKYRLVVATPNSPTTVWSPVDDAYLQNIAESAIEQIGAENIKAFWLVGHSQGGMTSNRLVRTDFFKDRVDGWLSLSGGRLGGNPGRAATFGRPPAPGTAAAPARPTPPVGASPEMAAARAALQEPPQTDFSFIYEVGRREMDEQGMLESSTWADKYKCSARQKPREIVDEKAGYVYDFTRQNPSVPAWGGTPKPGTAELYVYPNCADGRVVADVVRIDKGHTEGLEPKVTEELIKLMLSAPGGKLQRKSSGAE